MKTKLISLIVLFITSLFILQTAAEAKRGRKPKLRTTPVTLVQSVPAETALAHPNLPFAKDTWVKMIDQAKYTIDIEQMYVGGQKGEALDEVIEALQRASKRSVKIRFILSKQMIDTDKVTLEIIKKIPSLELRVVDFGAMTGGIQHAKFWIFDQESIFVGSQNFDWKALTQILETGVMVHDKNLAMQLKSIFDLDWKVSLTGKIPQNLGKAPRSLKNADVYLVANPPALNPKNIKASFDELAVLLKSAKKSVRITLLNLSTYLHGGDGQWLDLDNLLRETAKRGIKIQILVSHWNTAKPEIETLKSLSQVQNIEVKIATVPEHSSGPISFARVNHSKFMTVDDAILWVGTSNWSKGYFFATRGIEIIMKRPDLAKMGNEIFEKLWTASYTENVDINREYPKPRK